MPTAHVVEVVDVLDEEADRTARRTHCEAGRF
jgi:hypothetical protein